MKLAIMRNASEIICKPLKSDLHGYLYALSDGSITKIGMTQSPWLRIPFLIREHSIESPLFVVSCQLDRIRMREKHVHEKYKCLRINGEWFDIEPSEIDFSMSKKGAPPYSHDDIEIKIERILRCVNIKRKVPLGRNELIDMAINKLQKSFFK